jgi:hypothetical protein
MRSKDLRAVKATARPGFLKLAVSTRPTRKYSIKAALSVFSAKQLYEAPNICAIRAVKISSSRIFSKSANKTS